MKQKNLLVPEDLLLLLVLQVLKILVDLDHLLDLFLLVHLLVRLFQLDQYLLLNR
jgi:hypothetical protein